jgi:replicative DNA helicase
MSYYNRVLEAIEHGKQGKNTGIPFSLPELNYSIGGLRRKKYILLGANSSVGKTALADYIIISAIKWLIDNPDSGKSLKVFYESLEIDTDSKLVKWACLLLYLTENIIIDSDTVLSARRDKQTNEVIKIPQEIEEQIKKLEPYFIQIEKFVEINDRKINPTGIWKKVKDYCESNGYWKEELIEQEENGKIVTKPTRVYHPNNPDEVVVSVKDHIGLQKGETEHSSGVFLSSKKQIIDKTSEYNIENRNTYGVTHIDLSQFNRELNDIQRKKFEEPTPQDSDFKESGTPFEDCDICISPFSPDRYNLKQYRGYDLSDIDVCKRFIYVYILKNRGGKFGVGIPMRFLGECGYFEELPYSPNDIMGIYSMIPNFKNKIK